MKKLNFVMITLTGFMVLVFTSGLLAQEFPQWRGPERNDVVKGAKIPKKWPSEIKQVWKVNVGLGDASPVITGNRLYVFTRQDSSEVLRCMDSKTGKEMWQNKYTTVTVTGPSASLHSGPRSTPVVGEGKIVTLGVGGMLSCLDVVTGKVLWRKENTSKMVPQFYTAMSPLIADGMCFVHIGGKGTGDIIAFDLVSGNEKWKWSGEGPVYSSPIIMNLDGIKQIIFVTEKSLISFNMINGKVLWQMDYVPQSRFYNAATPVIAGQNVIISGQGLGTKAVKIQKQGNEYTANEVWNNADVGTKYCTPVLKDGYLYGVSDKRKIFCLDASRGQTAWIDTTMYTDFGSFIDCGSAIMAITGRSELLVLSPVASKFSTLALYKVSDTPIYAHPLIVENKIYIKDKEDLILYSIE